MVSIYTFSLFLWICLAVQVPTQGALSKITKVKRVDLGEEFKLIVEFEGDSTVEARWLKYKDGSYEDLAGYKTREGKTLVVVAKTEIAGAAVFLRLGHMDSHYMSFYWNIKGDGDRVSTRECPLAVITPGLDLTYVPNQQLEVQIAAEEGRGLDHLTFSSYTPVMIGEYWDEASNSVVSHEVFDFLEESQENQNGVTINKLTFKAGPNESIVGYFRGTLTGYDNDSEQTPVLQMIEFFILGVHKEGEEIPFPFTLR